MSDARALFNRPVECLVNGQVGREYQVKDMKPVTEAEAKKILVVGGGPAGCEFAIRAAEQGHKVTLWEKEAALGGQLPMVFAPPHKEEFRDLLAYYENKLDYLGVDVVPNKTATVEDIRAGSYDMVVTAMGRGAAVEIPLNKTDDTPVYSAYEVLKGEVMTGKNVLVIGGGTVGCETAQYIANEAAISPAQIYHMLEHGYESDEDIHKMMHTCYRTITVADIQKIGKGFEAGTAWPVLKDLDRLGVKRYPFTSVEEVGGGKAVLAVKKTADSQTAKTITVLCDTIVLAVGAKPNDGLYNELKDAGVNVHNIGDSKKLSNILNGVRQACELVESMAGIEPLKK